MKKYKLLKDLPDLKKGAIFCWDEEDGLYTNDPHSAHAYVFIKWVVETEKSWFELILPEI